MKYQSAIFILAAGLLLAGCKYFLAREFVPASGRYTVLVRDTGTVRIEYLESNMTTVRNVDHVVKASHAAIDRFRDAIADELKIRPYSYVPVEMDIEYRANDMHDNIHAASFSNRRSGQTPAREAAFQEKLKTIAAEHDLDFIIVISEWTAKDESVETDRPLIGSGVRFYSQHGWRKIAAYTAYRMQLFDSKRELSLYQTMTGTKRIASHRWIETGRSRPPAPEVVSSFLPDIETTVPPLGLKRALCLVGLIPIPSDARGRTAQRQCERAYAYSGR